MTRKHLLLGSASALIVGMLVAPAFAQEESMETVVVTGYRASLESSTNAKKASVGFTDAVFAEDIGKFPDTNLAEALNRIPGITMVRDINGEGVNVQIRGLGTNFTKMLLNNAQIAIATTGATDYANNNREVDLNMFPSELFTNLQVDKTPRAEILEGGAAGTVNMRTRRPFDNPGLHITYVAEGMSNSLSNGLGGNGALVASNTWEGTKVGSFGFLVGIAGRRTYNYVKGWEDGNAGWNTPSIKSAALCDTATGCDITGSTTTIGGDSMAIPATIPDNVTIPGFAAGSTVNAAMLLALNPGLNMTQLSNMLIPRLGRDMYSRGTRDRYNAVASFEWRPTERMHFFLDMIGGRQFNDLDRNDIDLGVRSGNAATPMIMANTVLDNNYVTKSTTLYNPTWGLEARPYQEKGDFFSINPGMTWQVTDLLEVDLQLNASRSHFLRSSPTVMFATCSSSPAANTCAAPTGGVIATINNTQKSHPVITANIDLNDPANYQWPTGRVNMQAEKRYVSTLGAHFDVKYGGDKIAVKAGFAYDDIFRGIAAIDGSKQWTVESCGGYSATTCNGNASSLIPASDVSKYLMPGPNGYVRVDYDKFKAASNYYDIYNTAWSTVNSRCKGTTSTWFATSSNSGGNSGCYDERYLGMYAQVDGVLTIGDRDLNYDIGLRWSETHQTVISPLLAYTTTTETYKGVGLGSINHYTFAGAKNTYQAFLPSVSLVYHVADDFLVRASVSRTMSRPDVSKMISTMSFSDPQAAAITTGNPDLQPYYSNNIDLGMEYYTGGEGYLSATAFHKNLSGFYVSKNLTKNFGYLAQWGITYDSLADQQKQNLRAIWNCNSQDTCANTAIITVTQNVNAPGIETINGLEFGYVQPFDFLTESWGIRGLGVTANVTVVDQSSSGSASVHATGVAPYTYNLTGYYDHDGIMARMSYVFSARTYASSSNVQNVCLPTVSSASGDGCPTGAYLFAAPYGQADFSSSLKLSKIFGEIATDPELVFNIQNVFNAKQWSYFQYKNAVHSYYEKGQTFMIGLHGSF